MIYSNLKITLKDNKGKTRNVKQCNVLTAEKAYNNGKIIWLHPCNLKLKNVWQEPYTFQKSETNQENFTSLVNSFKYYNCDSQRGRRVIFFIENN